MSDHTTDRILYALFCSARDDRRVDAVELARLLGIGRRSLVAGLGALERAGLVDAARLRLTMSGLAQAARLDASDAGAALAAALPRLHLAERQLTPAAASAQPAARTADFEPHRLPLAAAGADLDRPRRLARVISLWPQMRPRLARCDSTGS
jgi:hypothetical protein